MSEELTFEAGIAELERLVSALEAGEMTLEESFKAYERAIALRDGLNRLLDAGDRRIRVLTERGEREIQPEDILKQEDLV